MSPRTRTTRRRARQRRQAGFNLLEVMVALVVLIIAVVGAASLQTATTRANIASRNRAVAQAILQTWMERLKMDAMNWKIGGGASPSLFTGHTDDVWFNGTGFDYWGVDTTTDTDVRFCAQLRGKLLSPNTMRADVRVWWPREMGDSPMSVGDGGYTARGNGIPDCTDFGAVSGTYTIMASTNLVALE